MLTTYIFVVVTGESLVTCSEINPLDQCLLELLNDMAPLFLTGNKKLIHLKLHTASNYLYTSIHTGIPDLSIPVLEPMAINNITFNVADGAFSTILSSLQIRGLSKFLTKNLT